jgi:glucokinase
MTRSTIIGVDLGGTKVSVGVVSGDAVVKMVKRPVPSREPADVVLNSIMDAMAEVIDETVAGIGCGVPSVVDVAEGVVLDVGNIPSWKEVHLKAALEDRFGLPAWINNDANAFVVGEHVYGKARGYRNVVGMTLGTGLGTGVVIDGRLYNGANCGAGELGMIAYRGGLLEDWCAGPFFPREFGVGADELHRRARAGDPEALQAYERYGRELAEGVMIALYAFDPEILVFGGSISSAFDLFETPMRAAFAAFEYPRSIERLVIAASDLDNAAVLGAAALCVDATRGAS